MHLALAAGEEVDARHTLRMRDTKRRVRRCRASSPRSARGRRRCSLGGAAAASALATAGVTLLFAASPSFANGERALPSDPSQWVGRYCTTSTCRDSKPGPLTHVAGFGVAILGVRWLAGRSSARS